MQGLLHDLRSTARGLLRRPYFTVVAVVMLGVGIGASARVFTLVDALLLRPLDVREPERIVRLTNTRPDVSHLVPFSYPMWQELRDRQTSLESLFAWAYPALTIEIDGSRERVGGFVASGSVFETLGVESALGRTLSPADDGRQVTVLTYEFWQRRFGADPSVVGRTIQVSRQPYTVIGIAERGFTCLQPGIPCELIIPLDSLISESQSVDWRQRQLLWLEIHGRLRDGVSIEAAQAELQVVWPTILDGTIPLDATGEREARFRSQTIGVVSGARGSSRYQGVFADPLFVLAAIVGLLLLIVAVNVANLMLARAVSKRRETAIRLAIGASGGRILRHAIIESLLLAAAGAALGLGLSVAASRTVAAFWNSGPGRLALDLRVDLRLFAFVAAAALLSALLAGLAPAVRAASTAPNAAIQGGVNGPSGGRFRLRSVLLSAQVALSLCLLSGAILFARTLSNLRDEPRDFIQEGIVTFSLAPVGEGYNDRDMNAYYRQLLTEVEAVPGVDAAAFAQNTPLEVWPTPFEVEAASPDAARSKMATSGCVSPELFPVLGTPLLAGRLFDSSDQDGAEKVAIVNQALAESLSGNSSPLGEQIGFGVERNAHDRRVVGVVRDRGYRGLRETEDPAVYVPCTQRGRVWSVGYLTLVVRVDGPGNGVVAAVTEKVEALGVEFPVRVERLAARTEQVLVREKALATVSGAIAVLALLLAGIGLFSLASYTVLNERRSIGVRMAVGADRRTVLLWVLTRTAWVSLVGLAAGFPLAVLIGGYLESMLFEISSTDPLTLIGAGAMLACVTCLAALAPAMRAASIQPMAVLRED